jgi:signal peptidase I
VFSLDNFNQENIIQQPSNDGFIVSDVETVAQEIDEEISETQKPFLSAVAKDVFEWLEIIVTAVVSVVVIFTLFFRVATIDGPSMKETLHHGDKVIITNFAYTPKYKDIVVI